MTSHQYRIVLRTYHERCFKALEFGTTRCYGWTARPLTRVDPPASSSGQPDWNVQRVSNGGSRAGETGLERALRPKLHRRPMTKRQQNESTLQYHGFRHSQRTPYSALICCVSGTIVLEYQPSRPVTRTPNILFPTSSKPAT